MIQPGTVCKNCSEAIRPYDTQYEHINSRLIGCKNGKTVAEPTPAEQPRIPCEHDGLNAAIEYVTRKSVAASPTGGPHCPKCGKEPELEVFKAFHPTTIGTRAGCNHCGFNLSIDTTSGVSAMKSLAQFFQPAAQPSAKVEEIARLMWEKHFKQLGVYDSWDQVGKADKDIHLLTVERVLSVLRPCVTTNVPQKVNESKYLQLLRWFKLFYGFFQDDVKGRPSAATSALSEDGELQEFVKEAFEKYPEKGE